MVMQGHLIRSIRSIIRVANFVVWGDLVSRDGDAGAVGLVGLLSLGARA